jgi:hypothetical protein
LFSPSSETPKPEEFIMIVPELVKFTHTGMLISIGCFSSFIAFLLRTKLTLVLPMSQSP